LPGELPAYVPGLPPGRWHTVVMFFGTVQVFPLSVECMAHYSDQKSPTQAFSLPMRHLKDRAL
jgi:hypothetical protein